MTPHDDEPSAIDCIFENILGFMLPFFLASAGGDADLARAAITELAEAYRAATATELDLVGRILGFSTVAMDNIRLSMNPEMSDTKVLRYRSNAVALSRAAEQCRKILEVVQANRKPVQPPVVVPQPGVALAPPAASVQPPQPVRQPSIATQNLAPVATTYPADIEAMMRDAREMLAAFSQADGQSAQPAAVFPRIPDPAAAADAMTRAVIAAAKRPQAAPTGRDSMSQKAPQPQV